MSARHRDRAIIFRNTAVEMGGVLIKLGQFLSARADVMPEEYLQELAKLQDEVPPFSFNEVRNEIEEEFGRPLEEIFIIFDETPVAAASLAQVHRARIETGEEVAVKVQRPGIRDIADIDLGIFSFLMEGVDRFTRFGRQFDIEGLVSEFARTLGEELDFYREAYYAEQFRENFKGSEIIYIPKVFWDYTRDKVVTLESVVGIKISDYAALEEVGIDRKEVAVEMFKSYLQQVLTDGFFHADPHPGNLFVMPGPKITFVDFGMVGEITPEVKKELKEVVVSVSKKDVDGLIRSLAVLGFIRRGTNTRPIKNAIEWIFDNYSGLSAKEINFESLERIQEDIRTIMYEQPFTVPSHFGFLGRAFGTLIGLVTGLDPNFDIVESTRPYVLSLTEREFSQMVLNQAKEIGSILINLPQKVNDVLDKLQKGELRLDTSSTDVVRSVERLTEARSKTNSAIVFASLLFSSIALLIFHFIDEAYVLFSISLVFLVYSQRRTSRRRRL